MKRHPIRVLGRRQPCHQQQPARSCNKNGRWHLDLARRHQAQSIGGGVIVRIVLMVTIGVLLVVGIRMRGTFVLVLLMNQPRLLKQGMR